MSETACRKIFTKTLLDLAKQNKQILAVTSDARGSVSLENFVKELPQQFVEIGIAEQNEVGVAAGLATCGKIPFVCAPAPFLSSRSLEQIKIDIAYSRTNVKIIGVSGGLSYGIAGGTHHSLQDIAVMRAFPGLTVMLPSDGMQTKWMTERVTKMDGPVYMRMGRNKVPDIYTEADSFEIGIANRLCEGKDITIIAVGEMVYHALQASKLLLQQGIHAAVLDMHTIKPIDKGAIIRAAKETGAIVTVEEHHINGGLGGAVAEVVAQNYPVPMKILGIPDTHVISGKSLQVIAYYGMDAKGIEAACIHLIKTHM